MKKAAVDLSERAFATFAQAFLASITINGSLGDIHAARIGLVAGGYAICKFLMVKANDFLTAPTPPTA